MTVSRTFDIWSTEIACLCQEHLYHSVCLSGSARRVRQYMPAQTVSTVWQFPEHLVSKALKLHVCVRNTSATVFGFLGQLDELDNISDICVPPQTISIHCLFDNCTTVWDTASCLIHRIDFLTIACNVSVDFFYLKTCLTLLWCSTRSLTLCTTERYCLNIYMYRSFN